MFQALINLRIDAGDEVLKNHIENGNKNATYTSPRIQNEIIGICGEVIRDMLIKDAVNAEAYSILADESSDIFGKEQK